MVEMVMARGSRSCEVFGNVRGFSWTGSADQFGIRFSVERVK